MIAHVTHEDGRECDYDLTLNQCGSLRNVMMNPDGVVMLTDGSLLRTRDWMKVSVMKPETKNNKVVKVYGNKTYAKALEYINRIIDEQPGFASKSLLAPRVGEIMGEDGNSVLQSMIRRGVLHQTKGTKRGFPTVYILGPNWTADWEDSHHEGPATIEYIRARNGE